MDTQTTKIWTQEKAEMQSHERYNKNTRRDNIQKALAIKSQEEKM